MMDKEVSDKVDKTLASMFEIIEDCERLGLENKSVVKAALKHLSRCCDRCLTESFSACEADRPGFQGREAFDVLD